MTRLESLYEKYQQRLLIKDKGIYVISKECIMHCNFSGVSEGELDLVQNPEHTDEIIIIQEVFEAD